MFLPTTKDELRSKNVRCDIILVSGDAYIDSAFSGIAIIGRVLEAAGYSVGIISQPALNSPIDITRLGEPRLFWGISAGCVDSSVANFTALKKPRRSCDFTPGGINNRRPHRATIVYANLIRAHFKNTVPILLGGIEASLRRFSHFDFIDEKVRKSILLDSKADFLIYGMAERSVVEFARALEHGDVRSVRGLCYVASELPENCIELPSFEDVRDNPSAFWKFQNIFESAFAHTHNQKIVQKCDNRYVIANAPQPPPTTAELDFWHELPYENAAHPHDAALGEIRALATIGNSVVSHRGCFGGCAFCAITAHQGRNVVSRSRESIIREVSTRARKPKFNGIISDIGGPTANMFGMSCKVLKSCGGCSDKQCTFPQICPNLRPSHEAYIDLLNSARSIAGVRKVFVASGIRTDLVLADEAHGVEFVRTLARNHISGQIKLAPEHIVPHVLAAMHKNEALHLGEFLRIYTRESARANTTNYASYYLMAAHPACTLEDMHTLRHWCEHTLKLVPEQIQIFTPTAATISTTMFATGTTASGNDIFVEKSFSGKSAQQHAIASEKPRRP